jgi:thiamine pyrophosphate-dependent acetolactate synthase large subunit-like protein
MAITHQQALEVLAAHRGRRIVVTTMTSVGIFPKLSDTPLDFAYIPSAMGHGPALGLGLALAQPERGVVVVNGDGCMLMSLGSLVTLASNPANIILIVMDNGLYEVTGGQVLPGSATDFPGLARAAGILRVAVFDSLDVWKTVAAAALAEPGPACICLKIEGRLGQKTPKAPRPMAEQIRRLREALGARGSS